MKKVIAVILLSLYTAFVGTGLMAAYQFEPLQNCSGTCISQVYNDHHNELADCSEHDLNIAFSTQHLSLDSKTKVPRPNVQLYRAIQTTLVVLWPTTLKPNLQTPAVIPETPLFIRYRVLLI